MRFTIAQGISCTLSDASKMNVASNCLEFWERGDDSLRLFGSQAQFVGFAAEIIEKALREADCAGITRVLGPLVHTAQLLAKYRAEEEKRAQSTLPVWLRSDTQVDCP